MTEREERVANHQDGLRSHTLPIVLAVLPATFALLGAVGGAWLTARAMQEAQDTALRGQLSLVAGGHAQQELATLREKASKYFATYRALLERAQIAETSDAQLVPLLDEFSTAGYELLFYAAPSVGRSTVDLNRAMAEMLQARRSPSANQAEQAASVALGQWLEAYLEESARLQNRAMPGSGLEDFVFRLKRQLGLP